MNTKSTTNGIDRRQFLEIAALGSIAVVGPGNAWGLTRLEPVSDPLARDYPYRGWEDLYRGELVADHAGYSAHCIDCQGNCAFKIFVKDGIVVREEQLAQYPQVRSDIPDANPRGCQKGAIHSSAMYDADRLRHPMKRVGERGEGKWKRISWKQAATEIADKLLDVHEQYGPGHIMSQWGNGMVSHTRIAAALRFASLIGGVMEDLITAVGDLGTGAALAYGDFHQSFTSDAWFEADYIMLSLINPNVTRMPDAHYIWEAKYRGARVVSVAPDYNPSSIHADRWVPIEPGTDPFFHMSIVNVLLEEDLWDRPFVKEQTDLPLLVRVDDGKLLRQSDLEEGGSEEVFYRWDLTTNRAVAATGSMGSGDKTIALGDVDPALEGEFAVEGIRVRPAFESMRAEASEFTPETTQPVTGIHPDVVREEARLIAKAKKLCILTGFNIGRYLNGIYTGWAQALVCALTAHGGPRGGMDTSWLDWGLVGPLTLGLFEMKKFPRIGAGGMSEWVRGEMHREALEHFDGEKLKERVGFDVEELQTMVEESIETGQMPYYGPVKAMILVGDAKFRRNKGGQRYRERVLEEASELFVAVSPRMDSSALWADYVLPAASHYEAWDLRTTPLHRFVNVFTAPVPPVGESKPDWDIMVLLTEKLQERARARGFGPYQDGPFERNFATAWDEYTMSGKLLTDYDATSFIAQHSPELGGQSLEEGARRGFFTIGHSPFPEHTNVRPDEPLNPWEKQVVDKKPYPTLSGRITFYCDHDRFIQLGSTVPTARRNAGKEASRYPLTFYTPHTRWGIHSNWRSNKYMLRLQRGEPAVHISPKLAASRGIRDGDLVRVFNGAGSFEAKAKFYPSAREDTLMFEHGWEPYQFSGNQELNNVVATLIQPLELVGNWGHLKFQFLRWNPNQLAHESSVDIERVEEA
ncbi:MAG: dimethylsulfide dehydrogenase [Deltaproteobacteria bacterium]|nr:dimethylsulfide dehydrogenase [Deltaproteobacteria bacterium]